MSTRNTWDRCDFGSGHARCNSLRDERFDLTATPLRYQLRIDIVSGSTIPAPGNYTYIKGTSLTVTATPSFNWVLVHWSLDGVIASKASAITVKMDADHSLVAVFGALPTSLNLTVVYERDPPRFDPKVLNVAFGTTVEWINTGTEIHTTTSSNGT